MCGRYEFKLSDSEKSKQIKTKALQLNLTYKEGEIFPTDKVLCLIPYKDGISLDSKIWGLSNKTLIINARVESLHDKPIYRNILDRRCAIICNGFYEWQGKNKFYFSFKEEEFMYLAGLFNEQNELVIITDEAKDEEYKLIHHRTPIIMNQNEMLQYLFHQEKKIKDKILSIKAVK